MRVVTDLRQMAEAAFSIIHRLESKLANLEAVWKGGAPREYIQIQRDQLLEARKKINHLYRLADWIEQEKLKMIRASSRFG